MSEPNLYFAERLMDLRVLEEQRRADRGRLARIARGQEIPLARRARWWVAVMGFRLVALGAWLEARVQAPPRLSEQAVNIRH